jgi:hypothetical protein
MTSIARVRGVIAASMRSTYCFGDGTGVSMRTFRRMIPSRRTRCSHALSMRG